MKALMFCALLSLVATTAASAATSDAVVSVTGGKVRGRVLAEGNVAVFKGIPFAAPPMGNLRWRAPQPVRPWQGVRDTNAYSASCMQNVNRGNRAESAGISEDCLYLNVWSPQWPSKTKKPVMFWIFGGNNTAGSASNVLYDGASLSRKGVVVVTINYRLGLFGFFAHPELTAQSSRHASGNYGLLDQLAALKWVHDNIARFGGDPNNVTAFGQSAGSWDVGLLMASPLTKGLFRRGIQESGTGNPMASLAQAEHEGVAFAASLNAPAAGAQLKFLRSLPAEQLQKATATVVEDSAPNMIPSVDGWYLLQAEHVIFAEGHEQALPLMIGSNAQEMAGPKPEQLREAVASLFGINADKAMAYYGLANGGAGNADPVFGPVANQVAADGRQRCGTVEEALWHAATKSPIYEYQFDHAVAGRSAAQHGSELPYLFGNLMPNASTGAAYTDADREVSGVVQSYWTNFAKTGDPNGKGLPAWPKFDPKARQYLEFTNDHGPVAKEGLRREICDLYIENDHFQMVQAAH